VAPPANACGADCAAPCAEGFRAIEAGAGCEPVLPAAACPGASRAAIGREACSAVGVRACSKGFRPRASGFGCEPVRAAKCAGATIEVLGSAACEPIDDCARAFPPSEATLFVSASTADADVDATHFKSVAQALAVAPEGAVIAVDSGVYNENIAPTKPVSVVGRCAEQVVFQGPATVKVGLYLEDVHDVALSHVTLRGFSSAIGVTGAASVRNAIEAVVVEDSPRAGALIAKGAKLAIRRSVIRNTFARDVDNQASGILVEDGSDLLLEDSVVAESDFVNVAIAGGTAHVVRSILRDARLLDHGPSAGTAAMGLFVSETSSVVVEDSDVDHNASEGILVTGPEAKCVVRGSVVRRTRRDRRGYGRGIEAGKGSHLTVDEVTAAENEDYEILVTEKGEAELTHIATTGRSGANAAGVSIGIMVSDGAHAKASSVAIFEPRYAGLTAQLGGWLEVTDALVRDPKPTGDAGLAGAMGATVTGPTSKLALEQTTVERGTLMGMLVQAGTASFHQVLVSDTMARNGEGGRGVAVQDGAHLDMTESAIVSSLEAGIVVFDEGTTLSMKDSSILAAGQSGPTAIGHGLILTGGTQAELAGTTIHGSKGSALVAVEAGGFIHASTISGNAVGLHTSECRIENAESKPDDPRVVGVSSDTRFVDNGTRLGVGEVALPGKLEESAAAKH
jgi:hypothetical protein